MCHKYDIMVIFSHHIQHLIEKSNIATTQILLTKNSHFRVVATIKTVVQ